MDASAAAKAELPELPKTGELVDGRFEILGVLGEGGMGYVFRAHDLARGRDVALKLLIPRYLGRPEREERILREAELMLRVGKHPNLVELLDSGRLGPERWPFLSMELIEGDSLSARLAFGGALPPMVAGRIARRLAGAIQALHHAGIVHRDVTATNVLMPGEEVVLIDLSHAGDLSAPQVPVGDAARLTQPHEVPGTHHYMSREQARADPAQPSMDVYAFGVTLVYMLTGMAPRGFGREAFIAMQRQGLIESPRVDVLVHPEVPAALAELANTCTQQDAQRRPDIDEIVAELDEIIASMAPADASAMRPPPTKTKDWWSDDDLSAVPHPRAERALERTKAPSGGSKRSEEAPGTVAHTEPPTQPIPDAPLGEGGDGDGQGARRYRLIVIVLATLLMISLGAAAWLWSQLPDGAGTRTTRGATSDGEPKVERRTAGSEGATKQEATFDPESTEPSTEHLEPAPDRVEPELAPEPTQPDPTPKQKEPRTTRPVKRDKPPCIDPMPRVQRALESKSWGEVLELTANGRCWTSGDLRWSSRAMALYRLGRYEQCLSAANRSKGSNSKRMAAMCRNAIDAKGSNP